MSSTCPGCLLELPSQNLRYDGYFTLRRSAGASSGSCWPSGQATPSAHGSCRSTSTPSSTPEGLNPDKSVDIHLVGLYLCLDEGVHPGRIPPLHRCLADQTSEWPHLPPPPPITDMTVADVLLADDSAEAVNRWARAVWEAWSEHHDSVARLADTLRGP